MSSLTQTSFAFSCGLNTPCICTEPSVNTSLTSVAWNSSELEFRPLLFQAPRGLSGPLAMGRSRTSFEIDAHSSGRQQVENIVTNQSFLTGSTRVHVVRVPSSCMLFSFTEGPARPLPSITMHAAGASECPNVSILCAVNYVRAWVSAPHAQMGTVSPASTDSLTGCAGLAANGAGPRRCTAGVTPASVRTRRD